jgi:hypothetical protein
MSIKTNERPQQAAAIGSAEQNRIVASRWIDAFNVRDDAAESAARTARPVSRDDVSSRRSAAFGGGRRRIPEPSRDFAPVKPAVSSRPLLHLEREPPPPWPRVPPRGASIWRPLASIRRPDRPWGVASPMRASSLPVTDSVRATVPVARTISALWNGGATAPPKREASACDRDPEEIGSGPTAASDRAVEGAGRC